MIVKVIHYNYMHDMRKTLVASVEAGKITAHAEACEFAYAKTQNVYDSWSNPFTAEDCETNRDGGWMVEVEAPLHEEDGKTYGLRSSMMGDFFQVIDRENFDQDLFYRCAMVGFDPCDPVDYRVMGLDEKTGYGSRFRTEYIVKNPSNHFYRNGGGQGLDYVE